MGYANLSSCLRDLEANGELVRIPEPVSPHLEAGAIQRRVFRAGGPALLFTNVTGCRFPMAGNIFGTMARMRFIFRDRIQAFNRLHQLEPRLSSLWQSSSLLFKGPGWLWSMLPRRARSGPILEKEALVSDLPQLVSWPEDGGPFVTLPQVYSENPERPGVKASNLGMYRIQLAGNAYTPNREVGLHYQIHRGIGQHHAKALQRGEALPVNVFIGGPPALTLAAVMPLPDGIPEMLFAGFLAGRRIPLIRKPGRLPIPAEADFCISGHVRPGHVLPEGPFGDHLGYYSLAHEFPVLSVDKVLHRRDAVWPFTTVGRPPQEDSVFGEFIHELTGPLVPKVFQGVHEVNAVDAAGVHPLLLALGSERYVPFARNRIPQELLTNAHQLLGSTQTSLSKYVLIAAREDDSRLSVRDIPGFFRHILERMDCSRDLHFVTRTTMDTLDYSGISLNQGSKLILAAAGPARRSLCTELPAVAWPAPFANPLLLAPGMAVIQGPKHTLEPDRQDPEISLLCERLEASGPQGLALLVVVDDSRFAVHSWENFLWISFTRSDPATDIYGPRAFLHCKHWGCDPPLVIDGRLKAHHPEPLDDDPEVERRVDRLGAPGMPLHKII